MLGLWFMVLIYWTIAIILVIPIYCTFLLCCFPDMNMCLNLLHWTRSMILCSIPLVMCGHHWIICEDLKSQLFRGKCYDHIFCAIRLCLSSQRHMCHAWWGFPLGWTATNRQPDSTYNFFGFKSFNKIENHHLSHDLTWSNPTTLWWTNIAMENGHL
jgi:hypothetical protein